MEVWYGQRWKQGSRIGIMPKLLSKSRLCCQDPILWWQHSSPHQDSIEQIRLWALHSSPIATPTPRLLRNDRCHRYTLFPFQLEFKLKHLGGLADNHDLMGFHFRRLVMKGTVDRGDPEPARPQPVPVSQGVPPVPSKVFNLKINVQLERPNPLKTDPAPSWTNWTSSNKKFHLPLNNNHPNNNKINHLNNNNHPNNKINNNHPNKTNNHLNNNTNLLNNKTNSTNHLNNNNNIHKLEAKEMFLNSWDKNNDSCRMPSMRWRGSSHLIPTSWKDKVKPSLKS